MSQRLSGSGNLIDLSGKGRDRGDVGPTLRQEAIPLQTAALCGRVVKEDDAINSSDALRYSRLMSTASGPFMSFRKLFLCAPTRAVTETRVKLGMIVRRNCPMSSLYALKLQISAPSLFWTTLMELGNTLICYVVNHLTTSWILVTPFGVPYPL